MYYLNEIAVIMCAYDLAKSQKTVSNSQTNNINYQILHNCFWTISVLVSCVFLALLWIYIACVQHILEI